jgi:hypothetical protein
LPPEVNNLTIDSMVEKRTEIISVRMTPSDRERLRVAAALQWPGAVLTESAILLGLARMAADGIINNAVNSGGD